MRPLYEIAAEIRREWPRVYFGARPYLEAMEDLTLITDRFINDTGAEIVRRFLVNASTWRGEAAKRIKAELKDLLAEPKAKKSAPGVRDGVIVDADYWLWVDEQRKLGANEWTDYQ